MKCLKTDSDLDARRYAGERGDLLLLNSESPVMDLLLSNLKSPVTDGIIDIPDSPHWQADSTWYFFLHSVSDRFKALTQQCGLGGEVQREPELGTSPHLYHF